MRLKHYKAVKGLVVYQDKVLLLEKEDFVGGKYEVPGGRKRVNESDESALRREVKEEVGLDIEVKRLLNTWSLDLPQKGIHLDGKTYLCSTNKNEVRLSKEHSGYRWVPKQELMNLELPGWLKDAIGYF